MFHVKHLPPHRSHSLRCCLVHKGEPFHVKHLHLSILLARLQLSWSTESYGVSRETYPIAAFSWRLGTTVVAFHNSIRHLDGTQTLRAV